MSKSDQTLLNGLIHAIRSDLTILKFADSETDQDLAIDNLSSTIDKVELISKHNQLVTVDGRTFEVSTAIASLIKQLDETDRSRIDFKPIKTTVLGDQRLISMALSELIQNSLNYSRDAIYISTHKTNQHLAIRIEDFGNGIPASVQRNIGKPFSPAVRVSQKAGNGLGLAVAWSVAQQHGGALTVLSEEQVGTTVIMTLNLA